MLSWIFKKTIGIDVGPTHIKVLCLKHTKKRYHTTYYATKSLTSCTTTEALQQVLSGISAGYAIIALPDALVNTHYLQVGHGLSKHSLETEVVKAAKHHFPDLAEKMCIDYAVLSTASPQTILLAATHQDHILARVNLIERVGLAVKAIDITSHAKQRAFLNLQSIVCKPNTYYGLVSVESTRCELIVFNQHTVVGVYEQSYSDSSLTTLQSLIEQAKYSLHTLYLLGSSQFFRFNHTMLSSIPVCCITPCNTQPFCDNPVDWLLCYGLAMRGAK